MARTGRRFPSHVLLGQRQGLAVPPVAVVTPRRPTVVSSTGHRGRMQRGTARLPHIYTNRWPGYQWVGLPPINPTPKQVVVEDAVWTAAAQQNRARRPHIYLQRPSAEQLVVTPTPSKVVGQAEQTAVRRYHHGSVIQNRWPGYQWVGLPAILPRPQQVVQDQAPFSRRGSQRHGEVIQARTIVVPATPFVAPPKPVTILAAPARQARRPHIQTNRWSGYQWVGLPPITPLPRQVVVEAPAQQRQRRRGSVIQSHPIIVPVAAPPVTPPRSTLIQAAPSRTPRRHGLVVEPGVQLAASVTPPPVATPLPRQVVVMRPATPRMARGGHVVALRTIVAPVAPPRPRVIACPTVVRRVRGGHVVVGRPVFSPTGPPRPLIARQAAATRRAQRGGVVAPSVQQRAAVPPIVGQIVLRAMTAYPSTGAQGTPTI